MSNLQIVGRSSSLYTRMALIFAEELSVPYELEPINDMSSVNSELYAGNPALKLPILRAGGAVLFGALNICRAIAERACTSRRIVWPESLRDDISRNAQELVWHCMATQVQIVMGTIVNKLPPDNLYFVKARISVQNSLSWLDSNLVAAMGMLPTRDLSLFEVTLYCLIEHLTFRGTLAVGSYASLGRFREQFATRPSARRTVFRFDAVPE